jgi:hypothetical protein
VWINFLPRYWLCISLSHVTIQRKRDGQIVFVR